MMFVSAASMALVSIFVAVSAFCGVSVFGIVRLILVNTFPIDTHIQHHKSQLIQQTQNPEHTLLQVTKQEPPARLRKQTIFHNYTTNIDTPPGTTTQETIRTNTAQIHTQIVTNHMQTIPHNKICTEQTTTINKQNRTSTPTLHKNSHCTA